MTVILEEDREQDPTLLNREETVQDIPPPPPVQEGDQVSSLPPGSTQVKYPSVSGAPEGAESGIDLSIKDNEDAMWKDYNEI